MKTNHCATKGLVWLLALLMALSLAFGALAEAGTIFTWRGCTMDVALVTADPDLVDFKDAPDGGVTVMVKLVSISGSIKTEDIDAYCQELLFRDGNGEEHTACYMRYRGVGFSPEKGFSTNPEQDGFEMLYFLKGKDESAVSGAKLVVPTEIKTQRIIVSLDKAPHETAVDASANDQAGDAASFVLGGVRYTVSTLEDAPKFQLPNRMDGKEGHVVAFSYPGHGSDAKDANKLLYSGARLRQPNGDVVKPYSNSDNIGNPYELYFGLSDGVLLADCVFTITGDEGDVEIPLSKVSGADAQAEEPAPEPAQEPVEEPAQEPDAEEPAEEPAAERDANALLNSAGTAGNETAANGLERQIADVLTQCAEGTKDVWQQAVYRAGVRDVQADPEKEGVYTFVLRGFDPDLKALGKYQAENKDGYLTRLLENTRAYLLQASLTMEENEFTQKSVKALQSVVKKAAAASAKAFKDKNVLNAFADELFYTGYGAQTKKADELLSLSSEYLDWFAAHEDNFLGLGAEKWASFFCGQVQRTLDVSEGPFSLKLTCSAVNMDELLEQARAVALNALSYQEYDQRWENDGVEKAFLQALADNVLTLRKKTKSLKTAELTLSVDGSPLAEEAFPAYLETYRYQDVLDELQYDTEALPEYAAQEFPKAGWLSGVKKGTQVKVKAPKDSEAYYVILRDYSTDELVTAGFVRPGTTCNLRVPKGDYYFVMASGNTWYGEEHLFGAETSLSKTGLFEVMGSNYYHTVTLKVTSGGNMPIYGADEGDLR